MASNIRIGTKWRRPDASVITVQGQEDVNVHVATSLPGGGVGAETLHVDKFKAFTLVKRYRVTAGGITPEAARLSKIAPGLMWSGIRPVGENAAEQLVEIDVWETDEAAAELSIHDGFADARVLDVRVV